MSDVNSILTVDFGSVHTRLTLLDLVDGQHRLISHVESLSTVSYPANDIMAGFERGLHQMSQITGRKFLDGTGRLITPEQGAGTGVDMFAVTTSIGRPQRAVVVGLIPDLSIASAIRAISTNYINVAATISLDDGRSEEDRVNTIVLAHPDVIVIAGGIERGARNAVLELARTTALAVSLLNRDRRPSVIYVGNTVIHDDIRALFEGIVPVLIADNVRPEIDRERLDSARLRLGQAYDLYAEQHSESFKRISEMSQTGVLPSGQGYGVLADYFNRTQNSPAALIDVGSLSSTLAIAIDGQVQASINTEIGLGHSAETLLDAVGEEAIRFWLPFNISRRELRNFVANKSLRPGTIPGTVREMFIEHAMLRAGIRHMLKTANPDWEFAALPFKRIIAAGSGLTRTGHPGFDAMLILDSLQPGGYTVIDTDPFGLIPAMGAMAAYTPDTVVELLEGKTLRRLAAVVSLRGNPRRNSPALKVTIKTDQGEVIEERVAGGHLWRYTLRPGQHATVSIQRVRGAGVNSEAGVKLRLGGELAGLIIDARGRPLSTGKNVAERAELIPMWISELTGDPLIQIDPSWLQEVDDGEKRRRLLGMAKAETEAPKQKRGKAKKQARQRKAREQEVSDRELQALLGDQGTGEDRAAPKVEDEIDELRNVLS